jgi:Asp-tRNA(Asn)/Glu-tRNA(Gln) amidotransferase A subunit family amidase
MPDSKREDRIWTIADAAKAIASGRLTSEALVRGFLDRVAVREKSVRAWAFIDPRKALAEARKRDKARPRSRLHGIPFGVKDIIDTHDMPTEYGSPIYRRNQPSQDAACVALLREAGGVALGKAVTTEFATRHPGKTRNPHNSRHTPGGSSSGSAAAVGAGMVPLAFGTQTTGSVIRPAAYCGVVGTKPTYGTINRAGVKQLSEFLDTIGYYTRTVEDAALALEVLAGNPVPDFSSVGSLRPKIAICRTTVWDKAKPETVALFEDLPARLSRAGARVRELVLPRAFAGVAQSQAVINEYDTWRSLAYERVNFPGKISAVLTARLESASRHSRERYEAAKAEAAQCRKLLHDLIGRDEVIVAPAAPGVADEGTGYSGDPIFSQVWQHLLVPCVCVPAGTGPKDLPLGVQVIAPCGEDGRAFLFAEWVRRALAE